MKKKVLVAMLAVILGSFFSPFLVSGDQELSPRPLIYGTSSLVVDLDPQYAWDSASIAHIDQVCEGLFSYDLTDPNLAIQPQLAKAFGVWGTESTINGTKYSYTVELKTGVTFHDDSDFDAEDVVFTFDRLNRFCSNETKTQIAELYEPLAALYPNTPLLIYNTTALNATQVKFLLNYEYAAFVSLLCFSGSVILSNNPGSTPADDYYKTEEDTLIGTGPYYQDSNTERLTVFRYNDDWYGGEAPDILEMHWVLYDDVTTKNQAFLSGDIDAIDKIDTISGISTEFMEEYESSEHHDVGDRMQGTVIIYMGFDCNKVDKLTRNAMQAALDYRYIIEDLGKGELAPLSSIIPKGILFHDESLPAPIQNVTLARKLMLQAIDSDKGIGDFALSTITGLNADSTDDEWEATTIVSYNYTYNIGNSMREGVGELAKANFAKIGIKVTVIGLTWGEFLDSLDDGTCQIFMLGWGPDFNDPSNYINPLLSPTSSSNHAHINDTKLNDLMLEGLIETNPKAREDLYHEIQTYVEDLGVGAYLYTSNARSVYFTGCLNTARNPMSKVYFYLWEFDYSNIPRGGGFSLWYLLQGLLIFGGMVIGGILIFVGFLKSMSKLVEGMANKRRKSNNSIDRFYMQTERETPIKTFETSKPVRNTSQNIPVELIETQIETQKPKSELLIKFSRILKMSSEIDISLVAQGLGLTKSELNEYLIEWIQIMPFQIRNNRIIVEKLKEFTASLDQMFENWQNNELKEEGKKL
ncbi:ABC transporter substrate-binding protein [Candidatus Lokiarchaeum ossiferum]|uniref:ABC transporter substrate-binding protein n=1 Tax=Candidatus Lokiarchaeum ossiferum TaxID=2951803 RepID=UPI00352C08F6